MTASKEWRKEWRKENKDRISKYRTDLRTGLIGPFKPTDGPDWQEKNRERHLKNKREYKKRYGKRNFLEAIEHYGNSRCFCCDESEILFLTLDHIDGGGNQHRKHENIAHLATWAKKNNWPPIFRVACRNCNYAIYRNNGVCPHQSRSPESNRKSL